MSESKEDCYYITMVHEDGDVDAGFISKSDLEKAYQSFGAGSKYSFEDVMNQTLSSCLHDRGVNTDLHEFCVYFGNSFYGRLSPNAVGTILSCHVFFSWY